MAKNLEWEDRVKGLLKAELKRRNVGYRELAERLTALGIPETQRNIANKISRGGFTAAPFCPMPFRDWLHHIAIGGCAIALATAAALAQQQNPPSHDHDNSSAAQHQPEKRPSGESATTHFAPGNRVDTSTYRAICDSPKDKDHADLCHQWRMAEAAEWQILLTILGLVLLGGTLVFTAIAAHAARGAVREAKNATSAANETVAVTRDLGYAQVRAYLQFVVFRFHYIASPQGDGINVVGTLKNAGQSPAKNVEVGGLVSGTEPDIEGQIDPRILMSPIASYFAPGVNQEHVHVTIPFKKFTGNGPTTGEFWCMVVVRWKDVFDKEQVGYFRGRFVNDSGVPLSQSEVKVAANGGRLNWSGR